MRITLFLLILLALSSCGPTYQYLTVDSSQLPKDQQKLFTMENDTMQLTYEFSGHGGQLTITVLNKTTQPLSVNWARSALINNGRSFNLHGRDLQFIPPQTSISKVTLNLNESGGGIPRLPIPDTARTRKLYYKDGSYVKYKAADFTEEGSPIQLKSYLTFLIGPGNGTEFTESHTFYIGEVIHTGIVPGLFGAYHEPGDKFYVWWQ